MTPFPPAYSGNLKYKLKDGLLADTVLPRVMPIQSWACDSTFKVRAFKLHMCSVGNRGTALSLCRHRGIRSVSLQLPLRVGERAPAAPLLGAVLAMSAPSQGPSNGLCLSSGLGASLSAAAWLQSVQGGDKICRLFSQTVSVRSGVLEYRKDWGHAARDRYQTHETTPHGVSKMAERCRPVLLALLCLWAQGCALGKATWGVKQKIPQYVVIHPDILGHTLYFENWSTATVRGWGGGWRPVGENDPLHLKYIWYRNSCKHHAAGGLERCYVLQGRILLLAPGSSGVQSPAPNRSWCLQQNPVLAFCRAIAVGSQLPGPQCSMWGGHWVSDRSGYFQLLAATKRWEMRRRPQTYWRAEGPSAAELGAPVSQLFLFSSPLKAVCADRWKWDVGSLNVLLGLGFHLG